MSDMLEKQAVPRMLYLEPETSDTGMRVETLDLAARVPAGVPFNASSWTVEAGGSSPVDVHSVHELWLVASGSGELIFDGQPVRIAARDVLYFPPMKSHEVRNDGSEPLAVFSVWWS